MTATVALGLARASGIAHVRQAHRQHLRRAALRCVILHGRPAASRAPSASQAMATPPLTHPVDRGPPHLRRAGGDMRHWSAAHRSGTIQLSSWLAGNLSFQPSHHERIIKHLKGAGVARVSRSLKLYRRGIATSLYTDQLQAVLIH